MNYRRKLLAWLLSLVLIVSMLPMLPAAAISDLPSNFFLTQNTNYTCTLSSAAMMLRSRMYLSRNDNWSSITEESIKSSAWVTEGLLWNWTYSINGNKMTVAHANTSGVNVSGLMSLLNSHPEGIVLYSGNYHAVLLTSYNGDTLYCADPAPGYSGRQIPLTSSQLGAKFGSQSEILRNVTAYWYVSSYSITPSGCRITFDPNGGGCYTPFKSVSPGSAAGVLPTPSRNGYDFTGWYTSASGGSRVTESTIISSNMTVYAHWTESARIVALYNDSESVWKAWKFQANAKFTIPSDYPAKSGSYFSGWVYQKDNKLFDLRPGDTITVREDVNLYPLYITHADAISGDPVLIYNPQDFSTAGYEIEEQIVPIVRKIDASYWTDWSEYSRDKVLASSSVDVRTGPLYRYYYFLCPGCGDHNPLQGKCGCGASATTDHWREKWSATRYIDSKSSVVSYSTNKRVTTSLGDGQMWYFSSGNLNATAIGTKDTDSTADVIVLGYSSRSYIQQTASRTDDITAYRLLKTAPVTVSKVEVIAQPTKTTYYVGETFQPAGMILKVTYSNGEVQEVTEGFTTNGFDSSTAGSKQINVEYLGKTAVISVQVIRKSSATTAEIYTDGVSARRGQTVSIPVYIRSNPGIALAKFSIHYGEGLKLISAENQGVLSGIYTTSKTTDVKPYMVQWMGADNATGNGCFLTLTFQVAENAAEGIQEFSIACEESYNSALEDVGFEISCAPISISTSLPGDVNRDKTVNGKDGVLLAQYTAGWGNAIDLTAADVNKDGKVNGKDGILLAQYLAGWDIVLK